MVWNFIIGSMIYLILFIRCSSSFVCLFKDGVQLFQNHFLGRQAFLYHTPLRLYRKPTDYKCMCLFQKGPSLCDLWIFVFMLLSIPQSPHSHSFIISIHQLSMCPTHSFLCLRALGATFPPLAFHTDQRLGCQFLWIGDFIRDYVDFIHRSGENWHLTITESGIQLKFTLAWNPANVSKWQWDCSCWRALWHGLSANHFVCLWGLCVSSFPICMIFVLFFFLLYALVRTCSTVLHSENTNPCLFWIFERKHQAFTTKYVSCCSP